MYTSYNTYSACVTRTNWQTILKFKTMTNVKKAMEISSRFSDDTLREIAYKVALEAMRWKDETMNAYITEAVTKKLKAIDKINKQRHAE